MKIKNTQTNVTVIAICVIIFIFVVTGILTTKYNLDYSQMIATAGLLFAIAAFSGVLLNLNATYIQLRKAMAKPKLEVIFTETNNNEKTIKIRPIPEEKHHLRISVVNKGNAITDMFQISFSIPKIFNPTVNYYNVGNESAYYNRSEGDIEIVSFVNNRKYVCFVDMPTPIPSLVLNTYLKEYDGITNMLVIPYKIYGDWNEFQEGTLKITINKQEVPHAGTGENRGDRRDGAL